jgi:hypothetical protein
MPSKKKSIEEATSILSYAVAESVVSEASYLLKLDLPRDLAEWLVGYAEAIYANSKNFRKKINSNANHGNAGRDYLYAFMKHWLSSEILKRSKSDDDCPRIRKILETSGFVVGRETR